MPEGSACKNRGYLPTQYPLLEEQHIFMEEASLVSPAPAPLLWNRSSALSLSSRKIREL